MIAPKTYYHDGTRKRVVAEGDKDAKFLIVRKGGTIDDKLAKLYGIPIPGAAPAAPPATPAKTAQPQAGKFGSSLPHKK